MSKHMMGLQAQLYWKNWGLLAEQYRGQLWMGKRVELEYFTVVLVVGPLQVMFDVLDRVPLLPVRDLP